MDENLVLLNWNVRGLNCPVRRLLVHQLLASSRCSIMCLQESKLAAFTESCREELAGRLLLGAAVLNAEGTRGGVILLWRTDLYAVDQIVVRQFSITARFSQAGCDPWCLTTVYGPHDDGRKQDFLDELCSIHASMSGPWCVVGDFNLITHPRDKNNDNVSRCWLLRFRQALNSSCLREADLIGRRFTWSNEQSPPTLVRLDRAFGNAEWWLRFPAAKLLPQSSDMSDHCPLLLVNAGLLKTPRRFRFEIHWQFSPVSRRSSPSLGHNLLNAGIPSRLSTPVFAVWARLSLLGATSILETFNSNSPLPRKLFCTSILRKTFMLFRRRKRRYEQA